MNEPSPECLRQFEEWHADHEAALYHQPNAAMRQAWIAGWQRCAEMMVKAIQTSWAQAWQTDLELKDEPQAFKRTVGRPRVRESLTDVEPKNDG